MMGRYFLVWTALGLFMFSQAMTQRLFSPDPYPLWHHFTSWMVGVYIWWPLTPAILWLGRRFPIERKFWARRIALHVLLALGVGFTQLAVESAVLRAIGVFPGLMSSYLKTLTFLLVIGFHQTLLTYWSLLGVQYALGWYRQFQERKEAAIRLELRSSELQAQLVQAHLSALKMQLQPHFLFNTLNAIVVLVRQQRGPEAEEMLARLSDLLRSVLDDVEAQEVPLRRELEYLHLYLSIEQVRFADRLRIEITAAPEILDTAVPHMILQPLVENAIRHGISRSSAAGLIQITACRRGESVEIVVQDNGPGLHPANSGGSHGIGLANTRARLAQLYGDRARLFVQNASAGGVVAGITLPYRLMTGGSEFEIIESHAVHDAGG
jgi:signal transduction histidine kinase